MSWEVNIVRKVWPGDAAAKEVHALIDRAEQAFLDVLRGHPHTPTVSNTAGTPGPSEATHRIYGHTNPAPAEAPAAADPAPEAPAAPTT